MWLRPAGAGRSLVALAFSPSPVMVMLSHAGRKIQKLLELQPIPGSPKTASQDAVFRLKPEFRGAEGIGLVTAGFYLEGSTPRRGK